MNRRAVGRGTGSSSVTRPEIALAVKHSVSDEAEFRAARVPGTMRWHGWGRDDRQFDPAGRPHLWDYARSQLGVTAADRVQALLEPSAIALPDPNLTPVLWEQICALFPRERRSHAHMDRLIHAFGRSTRDLWRLRHGR